MKEFTVCHEVLGVWSVMKTVEADSILDARDMVFTALHDPAQNVCVGVLQAKEYDTIVSLSWRDHHIHIIDHQRLTTEITHLRTALQLALKP